MVTFLIGLVILLGGGALYGKFVEKVMAPDDRKTPAVTMADGVDYVVMPEWKNSLIELLNIAGTGPVLGPIQGIMWGPLAFLAIPIGCVIAGATHDYLAGMISMRNNGAQIPGIIKTYLGGAANKVYFIILMILMLLVGAVFTTTPGDLFAGSILGVKDLSLTNPVVIAVYAVIFLYYICATLFPIDAIIGHIYPIFGAILLISAVGIFFGVCLGQGKHLTELWAATPKQFAPPGGNPFIPVFFVTVACGILSGFHASQAALISRTVKSEKEGRTTFYWMMILEGFIAMSWAAGAMVAYNIQPGLSNKDLVVEGAKIAALTGADGAIVAANPTQMVSIISNTFLGHIGGILAILGVIVLPITSGDTAMRACRLMAGEMFHIDQKPYSKRIATTLVLFIPVIAVIAWSKTNPKGFNVLWQYFAFTNQLVALFMLASGTVYLKIHNKPFLIMLIPQLFYTFVVFSFILNAKIGFNLPWVAAYIVTAVLDILLAYVTLNRANKKAAEIVALEPAPVY